MEESQSRHRWDWEMVIPEEEEMVWGKECGMNYSSAGGNWRAPIQGWGARIEGLEYGTRMLSAGRRNWLQYEIDKVQSRLRSSNEDWGVPILVELHRRGGMAEVWYGCWLVIDCVVASPVKLIPGDGPNVPRNSSWDNITPPCAHWHIHTVHNESQQLPAPKSEKQEVGNTLM